MHECGIHEHTWLDSLKPCRIIIFLLILFLYAMTKIITLRVIVYFKILWFVIGLKNNNNNCDLRKYIYDYMCIFNEWSIRSICSKYSFIFLYLKDISNGMVKIKWRRIWSKSPNLNFIYYFRGPTSLARTSYFCYFYRNDFFLRVVLNCVFYLVFENHNDPTVKMFWI